MMGHSGGRSLNNPRGDQARRRFTPRERQHIDPPMDRMQPVYRMTRRGVKLRTLADAAFVNGMWAGTGLATGYLIGVWFR